VLCHITRARAPGNALQDGCPCQCEASCACRPRQQHCGLTIARCARQQAEAEDDDEPEHLLFKVPGRGVPALTRPASHRWLSSATVPLGSRPSFRAFATTRSSARTSRPSGWTSSTSRSSCPVAPAFAAARRAPTRASSLVGRRRAGVTVRVGHRWTEYRLEDDQQLHLRCPGARARVRHHQLPELPEP
jgi:hypothetical protein